MIHIYMCAAAAKSLQSCLTLCDPIDGSPYIYTHTHTLIYMYVFSL